MNFDKLTTHFRSVQIRELSLILRKHVYVVYPRNVTQDTLAERLRRRPAKPIGSPRVDSNPTGAELERQCFSQTNQTVPRAKVTLAGLEPAIFGSEDQRLIH